MRFKTRLIEQARSGPCATDLDGSGAVNGLDLAMLLGAWGECP
jgi:hypothetical protein